jgi:hypothetical protein
MDRSSAGVDLEPLVVGCRADRAECVATLYRVVGSVGARRDEAQRDPRRGERARPRARDTARRAAIALDATLAPVLCMAAHVTSGARAWRAEPRRARLLSRRVWRATPARQRPESRAPDAPQKPTRRPPHRHHPLESARSRDDAGAWDSADPASHFPLRLSRAVARSYLVLAPAVGERRPSLPVTLSRAERLPDHLDERRGDLDGAGAGERLRLQRDDRSQRPPAEPIGRLRRVARRGRVERRDGGGLDRHP